MEYSCGQSRTADMGWSSSMSVWRGANKFSPFKNSLLQNVMQVLELGIKRIV
jgi:hypothetical protein